MEQLFGMNTQESRTVDPLWDLIVDSLGALAISLLGWRSLLAASMTGSCSAGSRTSSLRTPRCFHRANTVGTERRVGTCSQSSPMELAALAFHRSTMGLRPIQRRDLSALFDGEV